MLQKDVQEAESLLQRIVTKQPDNLGARADLADFYLAQGKQDKARQLYQDIVDQAPTNAQAYLKLAAFYAQEKQLDKAQETVASGMTRMPDSVLLLENYVRLAIERQRPQDAAAVLEERLVRRPEDVLGHILIGAVATANKDYPAAEKAYRQAMALDESRPDPAASLAHVLVLAGQGEKGVSEAEQRLASPPRPIGAYVLLGSLHEELKQPQKAMAVYERGVVDHPENWIMNNNLAYMISEHSTVPAELDKALELARKAQLLDPENPAVLDTIGWIYYKMGKMSQAHGVLALVTGTNQNVPVFQYHLGVVLAKMGKNDEAKERLRLAVGSKQQFSGKEEAEKIIRELN
jgi:tetratricopeptide (TPR) repeat protein